MERGAIRGPTLSSAKDPDCTLRFLCPRDYDPPLGAGAEGVAGETVKHFRSRYSLSRYFTPPSVQPLHLHLARLEGGGHAPAQFFGETHDGREVYVRYRGGGLSVTVTNESDTGGETCILDVAIGPPLHGVLSIGQL